MEIKGELLRLESIGDGNWMEVTHRNLDLRWIMTIAEIKELSVLIEALLQELKGDQDV